ncbi:TPA: hypothetical protein EYN23_25270 [Candidatus Poribacteria bacterium]|nr:hypothetical protein [Candidatus Poribacteria bacterium]
MREIRTVGSNLGGDAQPKGRALSTNHCLVTDGVFLPMDGSSSPEFFPLPGPKEDELEVIAWATCRKVVAKLKRLGFWQDEEAGEGAEQSLGLGHEENTLNDSYEASIRGVVQFGPDSGRRVCRVFGEAAGSQCRSDKVLGRGQSFNVEAGRVVPANDRAGLERLVRYILRPPLSRSRLRERSDGQIEIKLKTARERWYYTYRSFSDLIMAESFACIRPWPIRSVLRSILQRLITHGSGVSMKTPMAWSDSTSQSKRHSITYHTMNCDLWLKK